MISLPSLLKMLAKLHGGMPGAAVADVAVDRGDEFKAAYTEYASATALASLILQEHGAASPPVCQCRCCQQATVSPGEENAGLAQVAERLNPRPD